MSKIVGHIERIKRIHTCSSCKKEFEWSENSFWYGTLEDVIYKSCSNECQAMLKKSQKRV